MQVAMEMMSIVVGVIFHLLAMSASNCEYVVCRARLMVNLLLRVHRVAPTLRRTT